jgi:hypothetical protein
MLNHEIEWIATFDKEFDRIAGPQILSCLEYHSDKRFYLLERAVH